MGYIYKITNIENGKVYIGQTKHTVEWRWHTHLYSSFNEIACDYNSPLHRDIRNYGIDSFTVDSIEQCCAKDLNAREQFWIAYYNSFDTDVGYNATRGGSGNIRYKDDDILELWNGGYSAAEIARLLPRPAGRNTVRTRLLGMGISGEEIRRRGNEAIARSKQKLIYQYSMSGEYIKAFYSASKAAEETKSNKDNISACAAGNLKSAGKYRWSYERVEKLPPMKTTSGFTLVGKYSEDWVIIDAYVSLTAAGRDNGISRKRLAIACEREELYRGFYWKYLNIEGGKIHV